jgi:hypothetical protein
MHARPAVVATEMEPEDEVSAATKAQRTGSMDFSGHAGGLSRADVGTLDR